MGAPSAVGVVNSRSKVDSKRASASRQNRKHLKFIVRVVSKEEVATDEEER